MDVREKLVKQAISHFWYGVSHDIFSEPVTTYAKLAIEALEKEKDSGVTMQELDGCKYCKEYEDLPEHFIDGKPIGRVFDTCIQPNENGLWHIEVPCGADIGIRFCPMCGRRLPQPPRCFVKH